MCIVVSGLGKASPGAEQCNLGSANPLYMVNDGLQVPTSAPGDLADSLAEEGQNKSQTAESAAESARGASHKSGSVMNAQQNRQHTNAAATTDYTVSMGSEQQSGNGGNINSISEQLALMAQAAASIKDSIAAAK